MRLLVLGATGTIGHAVIRELIARGHSVVCLVRSPTSAAPLNDASVRMCDVTEEKAIANAVEGERFDALISCLASRTGTPADARAIDYQANRNALAAAQAAGISHFLLLSAICVQKPHLAFQHAKLAFERELMASGVDWTIVRPTAFFKSLSGQIERVRRGKPFLVFGDGRLTACKPIADEDLAAYIADCLGNPARRNRILPIGGPGPAITPRDQGEALFALLGRPPRFRHVPVALLDTIVKLLSALGRISPRLAAKAELARIGRYYATEPMLVRDPVTGRYEADATPETGTRTLFDHYARVLAGEETVERGDHAVF